jgi:tetratricopeptide (TPR) repeat protein
MQMQGIALYPWLLTASLLLFLWNGARRREGLAMLILPLMLIKPEPSEAAPWTEQQAYEALQQGDYARAQTLYKALDDYNGRMGSGAAAYRRQDWQSALAAFERAVQRAEDNEQKAHALYDAGNALAQLHRFEEASNTYQAALRLQPDLGKAALNLSLVNQFLDAQRGEQQRKNATQPPLSDLGPARSEAEQLDQQRRGDDRSKLSLSPDTARDKSPRQRVGQQPNDLTPSSDHRDARLQQTLALWRNDAAHGSGSPELESLQDNSADFLRRRFREDDYGPHVMIIEGKPW